MTRPSRAAPAGGVLAPPEPAAGPLVPPHPVPRERERVLLTGASGMLATDLGPALAAAGFEVYARTRAHLDITDSAEVVRAFADVRPEIVVNCAAFTKVDAAETDPRAFEVNALGVELLASRCVERAARLVQISTDFVFDGSKKTPYVEDDPPAPISAYGRSKRAGEEAALRVPFGTVVRASWLFGRGGWNFIEAILKQVEGGKRTLAVVADQRGRPTGTSDLAEALVALMSEGAVGVYHFANGGDVSWFEFATEIVDLASCPDVEIVPLRSADLDRPAPRPAYSVLDTGKYERVTGRPIRHHRDALVEYLAERSRPPA